MDDQEYKDLGFMCGLEVHQRLATFRKLFCDCPTNVVMTNDTGKNSVKRHQRAIAGELGKVDIASGFEEQRRRFFRYRMPEGHSCLVEIDEEPPHQMNAEALQTVLAFARSMNMRIIDEVQPMRKAVVDGSDPSAFQRTTMIGLDGFITVNGHRIEIPSMFLEEESCRAEAGDGKEITYDLEMMGVPLVEIDTFPYIRTPKEAKEVALYIGTMMRISGLVQRGIGSVRQDVNVSIKGGARIEIKGLQEIEFVDRFIDNEVMRQRELLKIRDELKKRKASVGKLVDITKVLKGTKAKIIAAQLESNGIVAGFALGGFRGLLGREVMPKRRLGTEISDYAKTAGVKGLIHSDEDLKSYGLTEKEIQAIETALGVGREGSFIIIAGAGDTAQSAARRALERARYAMEGVPPETRAAINDDTYTTRFMRPIAGGSRMYPETDARPIEITKDMLKMADALAPSREKEEKELKKQIKDGNLAVRIMLSPLLQTYRYIAESTKGLVLDPAFVVNILLQKFTELRRAGFDIYSIKEERLVELFNAYGQGLITKQAVEEVLKILAKTDQPVKDIIKDAGLKKMSGAELKKLVDQEKKTSSDKAQIIKNIMSKHRLNVDGSELNSIL